MMDKVREQVAEAKRLAMNIDNWVLYIHPEDRHELQSDMDAIMNTPEQKLPWNSIEVVTDYYVDDPVILPRRPDLMPSDLEFQDHPPMALVKQMVEPEIVKDEVQGLDRHVLLRAKIPYEVRKVSYEVPLDKAEDAFSQPEISQVVRRAVEEELDWDANVDESRNVWVLHRSYDAGTEVIEVPLMWQAEEQALEYLDPEQKIAEDAMELIGGEYGRTLTHRVERVVEDDEPMAMMSHEAEPEELTFETETEEVEVAEKKVELGRMMLR